MSIGQAVGKLANLLIGNETGHPDELIVPSRTAVGTAEGRQAPIHDGGVVTVTMGGTMYVLDAETAGDVGRAMYEAAAEIEAPEVGHFDTLRADDVEPETVTVDPIDASDDDDVREAIDGAASGE
jgi:hypothetical protein